MSYNKTTWSAGDTITAEKLNNLENGVSNAGGVLITEMTDEGTDKSADEILQAFYAGISVILYYDTYSEKQWYLLHSVVENFDNGNMTDCVAYFGSNMLIKSENGKFVYAD